MGEHPRRAAGRRRHMEAVGRDAGDNSVVHHEARLGQHQAVAAAADLEFLESVGVHALEKARRVGTDDLDLAERGAVEQADGGACGAALARDRLAHRFSGAWKIPRPLPQAHILERRAVGLGPAMHRRPADGVELWPARGSGESAERHRRVGLAKGGETDIRNRLRQRARRDRQRVHVRKLALIGRHAGGGVALDVLDRAHALLDREPQVLGANIVLKVDKRLGAAIGEEMRRGAQHAARGRKHPGHRKDFSLSRCGEAGRGRRLAARRVAFGERAGEIEGGVARPRRSFALNGGSRLEDLGELVEGELAARLREQMHGGRPAARHQQRVARDLAHAAGIGGQAHGLDPQAPFDPVNCRLRRHLDSRLARGVRQRPRRFGCADRRSAPRRRPPVSGRARQDRRCRARSRRRRARRP